MSVAVEIQNQKPKLSFLEFYVKLYFTYNVDGKMEQ